MKRFGFLFLVVIVVVSGCDSVRNPLNAISGSDVVGKVGKAITVRFSIPYGDNIVYPGIDPEQKMAPAFFSPKIYAESNLFAEASYPESTKILFGSVRELNSTSIKVHTAVPGWIRIWFADGGTVYNVWINGIQLNNMDKNGAFLLMFDTDGTVIQRETEFQLVGVKFILTTNESSSTTIYLSSDVTGWAGIPMDYVSSKTWVFEGRYIPDQDFTFVAWSIERARYIYTIKVNGTEAVYLIKIDEGSKTTYPVYHFKGKVDQSSRFINAGSDNRQVIINRVDP